MSAGKLIADLFLLKLLDLVERIDAAEGRESIPRPDTDDGHSIMHYAEQIHNRAMHEEGCTGCGACEEEDCGMTIVAPVDDGYLN